MSRTISDDDMQAAVDWIDRSASVREASRDSGIPRKTLHYRAKAAAERGIIPSGDDPALDKLTSKQLAEAGDMGIPPSQLSHGWSKTDTGSYFFKVPRPGDDPDALMQAIAAGLENVPMAEPSDAEPEYGDDLAVIFPIADLHVGMLTDEEEVGEDWDTGIMIDVFSDAFSRLVAVTPSAEVAVIAQLGDLTHNDDQRNVTPQSKHQLDVDSRYFKILRRAVAAMKYAIDTCLEHYPNVIYRGTAGNHDMTSHFAVTLALKEHYRGEPRVEIVDSANEFYVYEYGANMMLMCHGHKTNPQRLAMFAASEYPDVWGRTKYRKILTGHFHHESVKDFGGITHETMGTIIPRDSYSHSHGYSGSRALVSIVLHHDDGEVGRNRINV